MQTAKDSLAGREESARRRLLSLCWPEGERFCTKCAKPKPYELKSGRLRCGRCGYTFHDFTGRWLNTVNLSAAAWLALLELFAAEATIKETAAQLSLSYNTAYKAVTTVRMAILANSLDARKMLDPDSGLDLASPKAGERSNRGTVFGIIEQGGLVFADYLPDLDSETLLHFKVNFMLGTSRLGSVIYTERYRSYDSLVCCPGAEVEPEYFRGGQSAADPQGRSAPFWNYARKRLIKFHGITSQRFPLYIKELEFRYNHRNSSIMPLLAQYLCGLVPNFD
jgi:transposase